MKKKIANLLIGSLLLSAAASHAEVVFDENFPNSGGDAGLNLLGWHANLSSDGTAVDESSTDWALNPIISGGDYIFYNLTTGSVPVLTWTDKTEVESIGAISSVTNISLTLKNQSITEDLKVALKVGGVWYVSQDVLNNVAANTSSKVNLAVQSVFWNSLSLIPGTTLAEGGAVSLPASGDVQAVGVFDASDTAGMRVRILNFTVEGKRVRVGGFIVKMLNYPGDIPINSEALMKGFVLPPVIFNPGEKYGSAARNYQGIPGIERAPGGRLWATWYAGPIWEDRFNYLLVATSGDDGATWTDTSFVIDPDGNGPKRVADPCLWLDPEGKLWLFFWLNGDGLTVTMAMTTENPDDANPVWSEPRPLFSGVMINKPIVTSRGEWLMPSAMWHRDNSCRGIVSKDRGETWALRGAANIPPERRNCDEEMIVERKDGSLWMLVRTADYGIGESVSMNDGRTWTVVSDYQKHATTRFTLLKLQSGNLLLLRNGPLDVRTGRDHMTAYLSDDDGSTWKGGLLLDERSTSYPDATQAPDGTIYAIYDQDRGGDKGIVMAAFTEEDILDGTNSPNTRLKVLVNRATGDNPVHGRIGEGPEPRTDTNAVPLVTGAPRAGLNPLNGSVKRFPYAADYVFSNSDYVSRAGRDLNQMVPSVKDYVFSPMGETKVVCTSPGMVYVLTPAPDRNPDSVEAELLAQGFEKTSVKEMDVLLKTDEKARYENLCSFYQKELTAGEEVQFDKWGILVF